MRSTFGLLLLTLLCACSSQPDVVPCSDPRSQVCTMEYKPACGVKTDGSQANYSSPCNACADDTVTGHLPGACPE